MWQPEAARGGTQTKGSEGLAGAEEEGTVRSIHRSLSELGMGTSAPTIRRVAGAAMAASPSPAAPAAAAGRRVLERVGIGRRGGDWRVVGVGEQRCENEEESGGLGRVRLISF